MPPTEQLLPLPVPRLVVRVGVTGHRPDGLQKVEEEPLRSKITAVLQEIKSTACTLFEQWKGKGIYSDEGPEFRLISLLADGADSLVAEAGLQLNFKLQCTLPFHQGNYEKDFMSSPQSLSRFTEFLKLPDTTSILELDGQRETEKDEKKAYETAGHVMLRHSDLLIAVWNGEPGDIGGTGQIVQEALRRGLPVLWIHSLQPHHVQLNYAGTSGEWTEPDSVAAQITTILSPVPDPELSLAHQFINKKLPWWTFGFSFEPSDRFRRKFHLPKAGFTTKQESTDRALEGAWAKFAKQSFKAEQAYREHFVKADFLATFYANRYRNSLALVYIMGAVGVLAAFLGTFTQKHHWAWMELALFLLVVLIIVLGKRQYWHRRWIDYRILAEGLWQVRLLGLVARATTLFHVPVRLSDKEPKATWYNWYLRAVVREAGLPSVKIDSAYLVSFHELLRESISSQIHYHQGVIEGRKHLHHRLHKTTEILFWLAALACLLHLVVALWHDPKDWLGSHYHKLELFLAFCVLVLPAFGAAISAILQQREFKWSVLRSSALKRMLDARKEELTSLKPGSFDELGPAAGRFSEHMLSELVDWHSVFFGKELSLP